MLTKLVLASVVASIAACVPCDSEVTQHGLAPRPQYDVQIDACITKHSCLPLCRSVFRLDGYDISSCKIELVDAANAHVVVRYDDNACSSSDVIAGDSGGYTDDGSTDDGSTDDGSTDTSDDGSTDTGDDGSTDTGDDGSSGGDGGGDSGGGDSGGDGGYRVISHEPPVKSLTTSNPRQ